jgi:hypothetical protein
MYRLVILGLAAALISGAPSLAQTGLHPAISPSLSPQDVASAFEDAVVGICAPAVVSGTRLAALAPAIRARLSRSSDPDAARQVGAEAGDGVWEVIAAKGVVRIREHDGRCVVSAYGPPAAATLAQVARRLQGSGQGFERLAPTPGVPASEALVRAAGAKRVQVMLQGSEPGMAGHKSRFSVLTATVFAVQG